MLTSSATYWSMALSGSQMLICWKNVCSESQSHWCFCEATQDIIQNTFWFCSDRIMEYPLYILMMCQGTIIEDIRETKNEILQKQSTPPRTCYLDLPREKQICWNSLSWLLVCPHLQGIVFHLNSLNVHHFSLDHIRQLGSWNAFPQLRSQVIVSSSKPSNHRQQTVQTTEHNQVLGFCSL